MAELVAMQEWVKASGAKICVVFEGRDTAGQGRHDQGDHRTGEPGRFRVVALPSPRIAERSQLYVQRYVPHLPAGGEVVIFDRSWYNRAGVERVMGFCTEEQVVISFTCSRGRTGDSRFRHAPARSTGSRSAPKNRPAGSQSRINDPRKIWKLSDLVLRSYSRWYDYSEARDEMFVATDSAWAPWYVVSTDDKRRARLNVITHSLGRVPTTS